MGTFPVDIVVTDPTGRRSETITALVDTGSTYTWVPRAILARLGIEPAFKDEFETADGRVVERDLAEARARIGNRTASTLIVFSDSNGLALLGAYTLEGLRLGVDPVNRRLIPVRGLAMTSFYGAA